MSRKDSYWQVGDLIDNRFLILEIMGGEKGGSGSGIVYKCYLHEHERVYALKTYQDRYKYSEEFKKSFEKEAYFWTNLPKHPNIVRSRWVETLEGRLFLILEYIPTDDQNTDPAKKRRNTLSHYLNDLTFEQILSISLQFCSGMNHAYRNNLIAHCDIKPDNIMITPDMVVKITDFGISRAFFEAEKAINLSEVDAIQNDVLHGYHGFPPYSAPEMFQGIADQRSDLYSFGILLYQMVSKNRYPYGNIEHFNSKESYFTYFNHLHHHARVIPLNTPLFPIIERCLEKDPLQRYQSISALQSDLEPFYHRLKGIKWIPVQVEESQAIDIAYAGLSLAALGNKQKSIILFDKSIFEEPTNFKLWYLKGLGLFYLEDFNEALACFFKALDLNQEKESLWYMTGVTLFNLQNFAEAIPFFSKSIAFNEMNPEAYTYLGDIYCNVNPPNIDQAIEYYDHSILLDPDFIQAHIRKANLITKTQPELAIELYKKILTIDPRLNDIRLKLGISLIEHEKEDEGIKTLENYLQHESDESIALFNIGLGYYQLQHYNEALTYFNQVVDMKPENKLLLHCLSRKTFTLLYLNRLDEAIITNEFAFSMNPEDEEIKALKSIIDEIKMNSD